MSNVRHFGAVGDGEVDDTAAIRHAIDEGDGVLFFPRGNYRLTETIELPLGERGPMAVRGEAGASCLFMHGPGPALRFQGNHGGTGDPWTLQPAVWERERLPGVRHLVIEGRHAEADGVELDGTMQVIIEGILARRLRHGIRLVRRNRNVLISHSHVYHNTGVGVFLDGVNLHQINVSGNHLSYNRLGGIRIERSEVRNLQITGNDIEYNNTKAHADLPVEATAEIYVDTTASGSSVNEITIASNTIQATGTAGGANVRILEKPGTDRPPGLWTISGNVIGSQEINVHLSGCYGIVVSGNTIYSCLKRNLWIEDSRQINVTGNHFRRHTPQYGTGVRLERSTDCIVSSSQFHDEAAAGQASGASLLELEACRRVTVLGCQFLDGVPYGIDVNRCSDVRISDCLLVEQRESKVARGVLRFRGEGERNVLGSNSLLGAVEIDERADVRRYENVGFL